MFSTTGRLRWSSRLLPALHLLRPFSRQWNPERIALEREKLRGMLHELQQPGASS